jgi:hypothetical protein
VRRRDRAERHFACPDVLESDALFFVGGRDNPAAALVHADVVHVVAVVEEHQVAWSGTPLRDLPEREVLTLGGTRDGHPEMTVEVMRESRAVEPRLRRIPAIYVWVTADEMKRE